MTLGILLALSLLAPRQAVVIETGRPVVVRPSLGLGEGRKGTCFQYLKQVDGPVYLVVDERCEGDGDCVEDCGDMIGRLVLLVGS